MVRVVTPSVLANLERLVNRRFSLDAQTGCAGFGDMCNLYAPRCRSLSSVALGGHTILFVPSSLRSLQVNLAHYRSCKFQRPDTAACVLIPAYLEQKASQLLPNMRKVHRYGPGSQLFNGIDITGSSVLLPPLPYSIDVWYDAPAAVPSVASLPFLSALTLPVLSTVAGDNLPLVQLTTAGLSLKALVDSGASHDFISESVVRRLGLSLRTSAWSSVTLADGGRNSILGEVTLRVTLGSLHLTLHPYVLTELTDAAPIILGSGTLLQHAAILDFGQRALYLRKGPRQYKVPLFAAVPAVAAPVANFAVAALCQRAAPESIGRKAAVRLLRKGAHAVLVRPKLCLNSAVVPPAEHDPEIAALLEEFGDIFRDIPGLPPMRPVDHTIPLVPGAQSVSRPMYRLSPLELDEVKRQVTDLLAKGMIRPSTSPYSAPILFVGKKDGTLRMCIDYRGLNAITVKNRYPLPRVDDLLDKLRGSAYFSSIDLQQGYNQIRIADSDIPKTAFRSPFGHYEYTVLSFGLVNAPATFQAVMNRVFSLYLDKFVVCYLDDILVFSKTREEHIQHLRLVFDILRREQLYAKRSKCHWAQPQVEYLGHIVSSDGIRMDPRKSAVVRDWPVPVNLQELRKFLGLTNYFRKFISRYSVIAAPLTNLTRKGAFSSPAAWTSECHKAFDELKHAVADDILLRFPDPALPFRIEVITDASLYGTGAVLLQEGRPVAFTSQKFSGAETRYTTGEQELLAVLHALKEWRCYLEGRHFSLKTDHKPLTFLQGVPTLNRRQARWLEYMSRFDYTWEFLSGSLNMADALSRHPNLLTAFLSVVTRSQAKHTGVSLPTPPEVPASVRVSDLAARIKAAVTVDPYFLNPVNTDKLSHKSGLWIRCFQSYRQVVVPNDDGLRRDILRHYHDGPLAGHPGGTRLIELVSRTFWWPRMARDADNYVLSCDLCQRNKPQSGKTPGFLQPLPVPANPWDSVSMDFVVALPKTEGGYDAVLVFVDRLTKMSHLAPTTTTCTAEQAARLFFDNVVRLHGVPKDIVSDRDCKFTSKFWGALSELLGIKLHMSTAYHPQTDGQTERMNRTLGDMLRNFTGREPNSWDTHLSAAEFALNNAVNRSTGRSPFYLNYGCHPVLPIWRELDINVPAAKRFAQSFVTRLAEAKACMEAALQRSADYYNRNKKDVSFLPGQLLMLSTKNLRQLAQGPRKLLPRYIGPFTAVRMVGKAAVELCLPSDMRIHPTFHVSLVRPYRSRTTDVETAVSDTEPLPVAWLSETKPLWSVERVLDYRCRRVRTGKKFRYVHEWLVKWTGYSSEHNSWEPAKHFTPDLKSELEAVRFRAKREARTLPLEGG